MPARCPDGFMSILCLGRHRPPRNFRLPRCCPGQVPRLPRDHLLAPLRLAIRTESTNSARIEASLYLIAALTADHFVLFAVVTPQLVEEAVELELPRSS